MYVCFFGPRSSDNHECSTSHIIFLDHIVRLLEYFHMQVGDNKKFTSVKESTNCPYYNEVPSIVTHCHVFVTQTLMIISET